jgi:hypothetical protein
MYFGPSNKPEHKTLAVCVLSNNEVPQTNGTNEAVNVVFIACFMCQIFFIFAMFVYFLFIGPVIT